MKEDIIDIQLIDGLRTHGSHGKKQKNRSNFGNWRQGITIVRIINVSISFGDQMSFNTIYLDIVANP